MFNPDALPTVRGKVPCEPLRVSFWLNLLVKETQT